MKNLFFAHAIFVRFSTILLIYSSDRVMGKRRVTLRRVETMLVSPKASPQRRSAVNRTLESLRNSVTSQELQIAKERKTVGGLYEELFNEKIKSDRLAISLNRSREQNEALREELRSSAVAHRKHVDDLEEEVQRLQQRLAAARNQIDGDNALKKMIASRNERIETLLSALADARRDAEFVEKLREEDKARASAASAEWKEKRNMADENTRKLTGLLASAKKN